MSTLSLIPFAFLSPPLANSAPSFSIPNSGFRNGDNTLDVSITHSDCSAAGNLRLVFPYQQTPSPPPTAHTPTTPPTPPSPPTTHTSPPPSVITPTLPPSLPVNCSYSRQGSNMVFSCSSQSSSATITMISVFVNGVPIASSSELFYSSVVDSCVRLNSP